MDNIIKELEGIDVDDFPNDPPSLENEFVPPPSDDQIRNRYIEEIMVALGIPEASSSSGTTIRPPLPPFPYPPFTPRERLPDTPLHSPPTRPRRNPTRPLPEEQAIIPPPYPWAGDRRCRVFTLTYLHSKKIRYINGEVHCEKCNRTYELQFNLREKFNEIADFIHKNVMAMRDRAEIDWLFPVLLKCRFCKEEKSVSPVIPKRKQKINWLFLFLGQMLGFCSLQQLKYFCRHTANYLTGGRDTVLYRVYMDLACQLDPTDQSFSV